LHRRAVAASREGGEARHSGAVGRDERLDR